MPGGPTPIGLAAFTAIKLAGYTGAGYFLRKAYDRPALSFLRVGSIRTCVGIGTGLLYGAFWLWAVPSLIPASIRNRLGVSDVVFLAISYFALLVPIRIAEWSLILWLYFDRGFQQKFRFIKFCAFGTGWSYLLDAVGLGTAIVVPGGFWVC